MGGGSRRAGPGFQPKSHLYCGRAGMAVANERFFLERPERPRRLCGYETCPRLRSAGLVRGRDLLRGQRRLAGADRAGGEALHGQGHAGSAPRHLRRRDRDPILGSAPTCWSRSRSGGRRAKRSTGWSSQIEQDGNQIAVEVKRPKSETFSGFGFHQSASAKLIVSVPQSANVVARSGDGSIRIERVTGQARAEHRRRQHPRVGRGRRA